MPTVIYENSFGFGGPVLRYSFEELLPTEIGDAWVATCAAAEHADRSSMLRERVKVPESNCLSDELKWFSQFTVPLALVTQGKLAWIECESPSTTYPFRTMLVSGPGAWPLQSAASRSLAPEASKMLFDLISQIGGWEDGYSGSFTTDAPGIEPGRDAAPQGGMWLGTIPESGDVWNNTSDWTPAVGLFHDSSNGNVVMRKDGSCGYGAVGEESFVQITPSIAEFLQAYTNYWDSGASEPFNYYAIDWDLGGAV
jgi:hypothetical protein